METPSDFTPDQLMKPEAIADPYPVYRCLRDHTPLRYLHFPRGIVPGVDEPIDIPQGVEALTEFVQFYDQVYEYRDARWPAAAEFEVPVLTGASPFAQGRKMRPLLARAVPLDEQKAPAG